MFFNIYLLKISLISGDCVAQTVVFSSYKHHDTLKFLIGITVCGSICFISDAFVGSTSDKEVVVQCGILNKLRDGDVVLSDRGFTVDNEVRQVGAYLVTPSFKGRGSKQLQYHQIEFTRNIARVRIHVERVIGVIRNKFIILSKEQPITILNRNSYFDTVKPFDKILTVCSTLLNICPAVVN